MSNHETVDDIPWDEDDFDPQGDPQESDGARLAVAELPTADAAPNAEAAAHTESTADVILLPGVVPDEPTRDEPAPNADAASETPFAILETPAMPVPVEPEDETPSRPAEPAAPSAEPTDDGPILPGLPIVEADRDHETGPAATTAAPFVADDDEPFERPGTQKLGIIGGKGVGKSYLFQAMVYRTSSSLQSGALTYYLENDSTRLFSAGTRQDRANTVNLNKFIKNYRRWHRLQTTTLMEQKWYRLRLPFRTGLFGRKRSAMDVEFFDGSGEGFFQAVRDADNRQLWRDGFLDARVIVFCLPLWVAFPDHGLSSADWQERDSVLEGFEQVVQNYMDLRSHNSRTDPVCSILALTMADDRRTGLKTLRDRWISPYIDSAPDHLRKLQRASGIARYLANARRVSEGLFREFANSRDPMVAGIPQKLDFDGGRPWLIPVSAIEGSMLEGIASRSNRTENRPRLPDPVPVHVELPLLVALCERGNALM